MKTAEEKLKEAIDLIDECRLQIEYLHGKFKKTGTSESVLARIYAFDGSYAKPDTPDIDNDSLTKDFREWLGWNDQPAPDPDDEDYYTYSWGLNVWCNAYKAYKQALSLPTLNRDKVMGTLEEFKVFEKTLDDNMVIDSAIDHHKLALYKARRILTDALCSLSLPTLSEEEEEIVVLVIADDIDDFRLGRSKYPNAMALTKAILKELTKPKEE